jgi:hypothetical protein
MRPDEVQNSKFNADQWVIFHHSPTFYSNFTFLLKMAEQLGVYVLPANPNKYSARNLKRFDNVDLTASIMGLNKGFSPMFGTKGS